MQNKADKVKSAQQRAKDYATLTTVQKIVKLDIKFGAGIGAKKERAKLAGKAVTEATTVKTEAKVEAKNVKSYQKLKKS